MPGPAYFPFIDGAVWRYNAIVNGVKVGTVTTTCTLTSQAGGPESATFRVDSTSQGSTGTPTEMIATSVYKAYPDQLQFADEKGNLGIEFKLPLVPGTTWTSNGSEFIVEPPEVVVTPFRKFSGAMKVTGRAGGTVEMHWYASGIGLVHASNHYANGTLVVLELVEFKTP